MPSSSPSPPPHRPAQVAAAAVPPTLLLRRLAGPLSWSRHQQMQQPAGSTAQANLRRILATISAALPPQPHPSAFLSLLAPPPPPPDAGHTQSRILSAPSDRQGIRVDLRLRLGPPSEIGRRGSPGEEDHDTGLPSSACSVVGEGETRVTDGGGGSSGMVAPETAESGIVSASYDEAHGPAMLDSNSPEERSSEGEWDARAEAGGGAEHGGVKEERAEEKGGEEEGEGKPSSGITNIPGSTGAGGGGVSDATKVGGFRKEEMDAEKKSSHGDGGGDEAGDSGSRCRRRDEGYLELLLEAVRQVSGGSFGGEEDESPGEGEHAEEGRAEPAGRSKRRGCWAAAFDLYEVVGGEEQTLGPVVRSKRGRSQALPSRYRDSVLEPWRKQSGGGGSHRHLQRRQARTAR